LLESETKDDSPVLKRKIFHDSAFGAYRNDTDCSLKIERSKFKYNDTHVFVDDKNTMQRRVCRNC
jgi:hypothetical protein